MHFTILSIQLLFLGLLFIADTTIQYILKELKDYMVLNHCNIYEQIIKLFGETTVASTMLLIFIIKRYYLMNILVIHLLQ